MCKDTNQTSRNGDSLLHEQHIFITSELNNLHLLVGIIKEMGLSVHIEVKTKKNQPVSVIDIFHEDNDASFNQILWTHSCFYFEDTVELPDLSPSPLPPSLNAHQKKQEVGTLNWGKGGSDQQCLLPHHHHHHPPLARSPFCGNFSIGFTSEKAHSWSLNDHPSLLRETRQGTHASSALSSSVGK